MLILLQIRIPRSTNQLRQTRVIVQKRAIVWMKENADHYGIDPGRVVLGGASAGGHLALLTAYTANDLQFTPIELEGKDISVCAAISMYGSSDFEALYYHTKQRRWRFSYWVWNKVCRWMYFRTFNNGVVQPSVAFFDSHNMFYGRRVFEIYPSGNF